MNIDTSQITILGEMTKLADAFAPFFFAVLYAVVIPAMAYRFYSAANGRHPPIVMEQSTTRHWFLSSTYFGFVLVVLAIAWFIATHGKRAYTYEVVLENMTINEGFEPVDIFSRPERIGVKDGDQWDVHLMAKKDSPFHVGDKIRLRLFVQTKTGGTDAGAAQQERPAPQEFWIDVIEPVDSPQRYSVLRSDNRISLRRVGAS